ncbi:MAG: MFS transporter [Anaerolineales bacterium]|nr:MFS transporter [Anaerolineae bacterium]PWB50924.1 MAG: MFS transporter [Anaerolineales bacterium]
MKSSSRYRWVVVAIFFLFTLLHQADKLLIGPMTEIIIQDFNITMTQMGLVSTGALIVGAIFYPIWGYLYDRFARPKLLALASFIWGATTWLNAIAPTYSAFLVTRSSTGIDDSSYPGMYSLISDYFGPKLRGKVYGLLQFTQPLGYLVGMVLGLLLAGVIGWRGVFYITGSLGVLMAFVIFFGVKDVPRGQSEPEMAGVEIQGQYKFSLRTAGRLFTKPSLLILFIQGFFGVFPWNAITIWFFYYLGSERGFDSNTQLIVMVIAVLVLAIGYPIGGTLGDFFFKRDRRGRLYVSMVGVLLGAIFLYFCLNVPNEDVLLFTIMLALTALFMPWASPNVISTVYDITLPEVRSTALSIQYLIESAGAATAPLIVGLIADQSSLKNAFLIICIATWVLCAGFFVVTSLFIRKDISVLRDEMSRRAEQEKSHQPGLEEVA